MKVCKSHKRRNCFSCQTGLYETPATNSANNPDLYVDISGFSLPSDLGSSSSSSSYDSSSSSDSGSSCGSD